MELKQAAPEMDALRLGMDWDQQELSMPQILVESTYGQSHPGSVHLDRLSDGVCDGLKYSGMKPSKMYVTDMCDGIAQGHDGMRYSLVSRELIAGMCDVHIKANAFDGAVFLSSCDKALPAHLIAMARGGVPAIHMPGGVMPSAEDGFTLEQIGTVHLAVQRAEMTREEFCGYQLKACPSQGACQFMGTAGTMQVISEALGLCLPYAALMPANTKYIQTMAKKSGYAVANLVKKGITVSDILTKKALHNALVLLAAVGGSTNAMIHLPAIAKAAGLQFDPKEVDRLNRIVPLVANTRPSGQYSTEQLWKAGGVPAVMRMVKEHLHLDVLTVTGKTLGENLEELHPMGQTIPSEDIIKPMGQGSLAVLYGNVAPKGAVVKYAALDESQHHFCGTARVFYSEQEARQAIVDRTVQSGDILVLPFAGPKGLGMPEMFYTTEALASDEVLSKTTALITDGRFSGASRGPCIGHISPEAAEGGPIGKVRNGDRIEIDLKNRSIRVLEEGFETRSITTPDRTPQMGILEIYQSMATSAMDGAYLQS